MRGIHEGRDAPRSLASSQLDHSRRLYTQWCSAPPVHGLRRAAFASAAFASKGTCSYQTHVNAVPQ